MNYELSPYGAIIIVVLAIMAGVVYWWVDPNIFKRLRKPVGLLVLQLLIAGGYTWGLYQLHAWWASLVWLLLMTGASAWVALVKAHERQWQKLLPLFVGLLVGVSVVSFSLLLSLKGLPSRLMIVVVAAVVLHQLTDACAASLKVFEASLRHTVSHRQYLLANGATPLEMLMPSIRRALRATVVPQFGTVKVSSLVIMPLLTGGLLIGGVQPLPAIAISALMIVAVFAASVLSTVLMLVVHHYYIK